MQDTHELLRVLPSRVPAAGESYYDFTRYFFATLASFSRAAVQLSRYIGGLHIRRNFASDPNALPPSEPVSAEKQRRALRLIVDYIFAEKAFDLPKGLYLRLAPNPYGFGGAVPPDAPVRDFQQHPALYAGAPDVARYPASRGKQRVQSC